MTTMDDALDASRALVPLAREKRIRAVLASPLAEAVRRIVQEELRRVDDGDDAEVNA